MWKKPNQSRDHLLWEVEYKEKKEVIHVAMLEQFTMKLNATA